jgi:type 2 lantibiotic biosynthesis protein LanM
VLTFESGVRIVYKPRSLDLDRHFYELLCWLNERGWEPEFRPRRNLLRGNYGWSEYIAKDDCSTPDMVRRFYERHGGLLAVAFLLVGCDFHFENVVASGEHPYLIDVETFFHAPLASIASPRNIDRRTVIGSGLLPQLRNVTETDKGCDISGIGGRGGTFNQAVDKIRQSESDEVRLVKEPGVFPEHENRPTLDGALVDPLHYCDEVVSGFSRMYELIMKYRQEFMASDGPLMRFADDPVRVILRPTRLYGALLHNALHPDLLQSGLDQSRFIDSLWTVGDRPPAFVRSELRDLCNGDIPLFSSRVDSTTVSSSDGEQFTGLLGGSGLSVAIDRLSQMSSDEKARQIWHIRAAFQMAGGRPTAGVRQPDAHVALRKRALAIATRIGKRLAQLAFDADADPFWSTVQHVGREAWCISNVSDGLYSGRAGIVLFLAHLARETGDAGLEQLCKKIGLTLGRSVSESGLAGVGGYVGTSGTVYALAHLGAMWRDDELLDRSATLAASLLPQIESDPKCDVLSGSAGLILSLLACENVLSRVDVMPIVVAAGNRLLESAVSQERGCGWTGLQKIPLTGFSHGAAGIGAALARLSARVGDGRYAEYARLAFEYERGVFCEEQQDWPDLRDDITRRHDPSTPAFSNSWCNGAAGIALSRAVAKRWLADEEMSSEIRVAIRACLVLGEPSNDSLCHGSFGNLECLSVAAAAIADSGLMNAVAARQALAVDSVERKGVTCGTDSDVAFENPGLMTGLAGVGYGLLRIAAPSSVPCVLSLEGPLA